MPPSSAAERPAPGSVADTVARLFLWARRAPKGLARVEYDNEFSRRAVVNELRQKCEAGGIPFHEIDLPVRRSAADVVRFLDARLGTLVEPGRGVVSVGGLATAFNPNVSLLDSLRVLNFNRDRLARFALCQIWWMTPAVADVFLRALPDLNSWFLVRLHLTEMVPPPDGTPLLNFGLQEPRALTSLADVERQVAYLVERLGRTLEANASLAALTDLAEPAVQALREAGADEEAKRIAESLVGKIAHKRLPPLDAAAALGDTLEAPRLWKPALDGDAREQARAVLDLARLYDWQNKSIAAEALYRHALSLTTAWEDNAGNVGLILSALALLHGRRGDFAKASELFERALSVVEKSFPPDDPRVAMALNNLGFSYSVQKRYAEAEPLLGRALAIHEAARGADHPGTTHILNNYATLLRALGRNDEAQAMEERVEGVIHTR